MLTTEKLMLANPKSVSPETTIAEARLMMEAEGILQLPVLDEDKLVGIITDRDLCVAIHSPAVHQKLVLDFMTADPITVSPDTPIFRAAQIMSTYKFGALPVVAEEKLIGLLTSNQLLAYFASKLETL